MKKEVKKERKKVEQVNCNKCHTPKWARIQCEKPYIDEIVHALCKCKQMEFDRNTVAIEKKNKDRFFAKVKETNSKTM